MPTLRRMQREKGRVMNTMSQERVKRNQPHIPILSSLIFESSASEKILLKGWISALYSGLDSSKALFAFFQCSQVICFLYS